MILIPKDRPHFSFDRSVEPVARVATGGEVTFETMDACCGEVRTTDEFLRRRDSGRKSGPLAGPVFVEGAEPGGDLVVEILAVELDETGFQAVGPQRAIVEDEVPELTCCEVRIRGDFLALPNGMTLPIKPVIGTLGNAPAGEPYKDACPLGGNQDVPAVTVGCTVYLPIDVPGALFSLGDVHACQGDGEVVGAPEIGARVTVRFDVLPELRTSRIMIEDETHWHTPVGAQNEYEAARGAVFHNAAFIRDNYGLAFKDALIFLTMAGQLTISRTGLWGRLGPVVCSSFAKDLAVQAAAEYRGDD